MVPDCYSKIDAEDNYCADTGDVWFNFTCMKNAQLTAVNITEEVCKNMPNVITCENVTTYPEQEFWFNQTKLQVSSSEEYFK